MPEGQVYNLGSVSVLKLVSSLVPVSSMRRILDTFLAKDKAKLSVDLDALRALLAPKRALWATDTSSMGGSDMDAKSFSEKLATVEKTLEFLEGAVKASSPKVAKAVEALVSRIAALKVADDGKPWEKDEEKEEDKEGKKEACGPAHDKEMGLLSGVVAAPAAPVAAAPTAAAPTAAAPTYDTLDENAKIAEAITAAINAADAGVDAAVAAGKPVKAAKAKGDLFKIASRLASILQDTDAAQPWVKDELIALSSRAETIKSYFPSK